ncbi:hypothetical protein D3C85_239510 [compost metagenome]|jgi:hypothetical protein
MLKTLKAATIALIAIAVIALTLYKGIPGIIGYIEGKAVAEVNGRQQEARLTAQLEMADLTIEFNQDLSKEVAASAEYFRSVDEQLDEIIKTRRANAVELPAIEIKATRPITTKPLANTPELFKPKEDDISELSLAWQSFCQLRPSYKDCIEGTHP